MTTSNSTKIPTKAHNSLMFDSYMNQINQVLSLDYVPSDKDILQMYVPTTDASIGDFEVDSRRYEVFDVSGRRSNRKKWTRTFEQCHQVIFVAPLSGYDECIIEDTTVVSHELILRLYVMSSRCKADLSSVQNQIQESLCVFEGVVAGVWFTQSAITLLLTKMDLFEHKVKDKPIRDYFPDYLGPSNDSEAGRDFFVHKYLSLSDQHDRKIDVVCADVTDTTSFEPKLTEIMKTAADISDMEARTEGVLRRSGFDFPWETTLAERQRSRQE